MPCATRTHLLSLTPPPMLALLPCCSTLIVTEECLLHPSRNPHYGKAGIEAVLKVHCRFITRMP